MKDAYLAHVDEAGSGARVRAAAEGLYPHLERWSNSIARLTWQHRRQPLGGVPRVARREDLSGEQATAASMSPNWSDHAHDGGAPRGQRSDAAGVHADPEDL